MNWMSVEKEKIVAKRDHYQNVKGGKKVRVLTAGKRYVYIKSGYNIMVVNDIDITSTYKSSLFNSVCDSRNSKLKDLGI